MRWAGRRLSALPLGILCQMQGVLTSALGTLPRVYNSGSFQSGEGIQSREGKKEGLCVLETGNPRWEAQSSSTEEPRPSSAGSQGQKWLLRKGVRVFVS